MNLKKAAMFLLLGSTAWLSAGCEPGQHGYGWRTVECFDSGKQVYTSQWEACPTFAGTGYAKLESGKVIKGECMCSTRDR